jgi:putative sterol carrier protein
MSRFSTDQEVYDDLGKILTSAAADEGLSTRLKETDAVVQYRVTDPEATLTLDARKKSGTKVELGETKLEPEIVFSLAADTAHQLLNGELNLTAALASGEIATKGPVTKVLRLLPVTTSLGGAPEAPSSEAPAESKEPEADAPEAEEPEAEAPETEVAEAESSEAEAAPEAPSAD